MSTQILTDSEARIAMKSLVTTCSVPPRDRFGQFRPQPLKSSWRKSDEVTLEVSIKAASMNEAMSERVKLLQEAAILAQFRHPNVVRLHGITNKDNVVRSIRISH